jgi:cytochrome c oxidase assembly protein subunit 15
MAEFRFILPTAYYLTRYRLPRSLQAKLLAIGVGIGAQGALGWFMVKSGLDEQIITDKAVPRVSQYRLAAHLSAALALYVGMVYTAVGLRRDVKMTSALRTGGTEVVTKLNNLLTFPAVKRYRGLVHLAAAMVFFTAASGAFVAGLDAGLVYNEFPTMGGRLVPPTDELLDTRYAKRSDQKDNWWRNMLENPVTAQFDHRLFVSRACFLVSVPAADPQAITTFAVLISLPFIARSRSLRSVLPKSSRRLTDLTAAAAITQVTLGITTLLYLVPIPLAATHQAGSVVLLTCLMGLMGSLRRPGKLVQALQRHLSKSSRLV